MLMALLMGPMMERSLYQALNLSHGSMMVFVQRPISATLLSIIVLMSIYVGIRALQGEEGRHRGSGGVTVFNFTETEGPGAAGRRPGPFHRKHRHQERRMQEPRELTIREAGERMKAGELTAERLVESCLERIHAREEIDPRLGRGL